MSIPCSIITDDGIEAQQMSLAVVPRVGEMISLQHAGEAREYRVRQITHSDVSDTSMPSVTIQASAQML